ncbi:HNH endonuclease family protein [Nakamurella leprariae]|uniref:DUF1524 domain-containing protein n=1 Tax=Nakamurella leprariae TaxID=2803911 RepID=A0A938Y5Z3_9ACTN|nr:HNH endonuclease family protein [Nakamurella leprariae]MBM9466666.1 DUF1524 domain-containing protein [Nakamurella leprariae]
MRCAVPRPGDARRRLAAALTLLVVGTGGCAWLPPTDPAPSAGTAPASSAIGAGVSTTSATGALTAQAALEALPVKGRAPRTGYDRDEFGSAWTDDVDLPSGHNGCDQRSDVLRRDLREVVLKPDSRGCVPLSGTLLDPYTGDTVSFVRGPDTSAQVQIDHVVALSNAWQTGAQQLDEQRRTELAADPLNLMAVQGSVNQAKGAGDAATWLPPARSSWCGYVARQVAVKRSYGLWVTPPEQEAIARILDGCPGQPLPGADDPGVVTPDPAT